MNDRFIQCPCDQSPACYEQTTEEGGKTWMCFSCGMTSNTFLKQNSDLQVRTHEAVPELYKDLSFVDKDGFVWYPATMTVPGKGLVSIDGTDRENWKWMAAKPIPVPEEEKHRFPGQLWKIDYKNAKLFDKGEFAKALEEVGFFED